MSEINTMLTLIDDNSAIVGVVVVATVPLTPLGSPPSSE
jgi:hypothetical protein